MDLESKIKHCEVGNMPLNLSNKVGEGTAAMIYKFSLRNKDAAVKCFRQPISKRKILQVAVKLRELKHNNIVRFRGYSVKPSALFFEFCAVKVEDDVAHNLTQLISLLNELDIFIWRDRLEYISQATCGLNFLHRNNVVHRDFKPANLLVTGSLEKTIVKLADFDDVVILKETVVQTMTINSLKGMTLAYTAPELCNRSVRKPSKETDIYAWSITCYEILSDMSSAWTNILPIMNDQLLLEAIKNNERPDIGYLKDIWHSEKNEPFLCLLSQAWSTQHTSRPVCEQVSHYIVLIFVT